MDSDQRPIRVVVRVKYENRVRAECPQLSGSIEYHNRRFAPPLQRIAANKYVVQQHCQRVFIGLGCALRLSAVNFGCCKVGGIKIYALGLVRADIVVIANEDLAVVRIEEDVAERDVALAQAFRMKL